MITFTSPQPTEPGPYPLDRRAPVYYRAADDLAVDQLFARARRPLAVFWGIAPVAPLHLGYDPLLLGLREVVEARGAQLTVLLADLSASLSHRLHPDEASARARTMGLYLEAVVGLRARYLLGSAFKLQPDYTRARFLAEQRVSPARIKQHLPGRARRDLSKGRGSLATLALPLMQCLDPAWLGAELVLGDSGQEKFYALCDRPERAISPVPDPTEGTPPRLVRTRTLPLGTDILGKPLGESRAATRISVHESEASLADKVRRMYAPPPGQPLAEGRVNALLATFRDSVFPWQAEPVRVRGQGGGEVLLDSAPELEEALARGLVHIVDAKEALARSLWRRLQATQAALGTAATAWVDLDAARGLRTSPRPPRR